LASLGSDRFLNKRNRQLIAFFREGETVNALFDNTTYCCCFGYPICIAAALVTLFLISIVAFIIIQLPPGDFVDAYAGKKTQGGVIITQDELDVMRVRLGMDKPLYQQYLKWIGGVIRGDLYQQYLKWIGGVIRGDLGFSWEYHRPVADVIGERLPLTLVLAFATLAFTYMVAIPIGIYSAVRQYSIGDNIATILGYIGLATPGFLFALILMYLGVWYECWRAIFTGVRRCSLELG